MGTYILALCLAVFPVAWFIDIFAIVAIIKSWGNWAWTCGLVVLFLFHGNATKTYALARAKEEITRKEFFTMVILYNCIFALINAYAMNKFYV